jgi:hypothetical protein
MAMSKTELSKWPWNNQPSARHVWGPGTYKNPTANWSGYASTCLRCGRHFNERADTRAPVYCYATEEWLVAHPDDGGKEG